MEGGNISASDQNCGHPNQLLVGYENVFLFGLGQGPIIVCWYCQDIVDILLELTSQLSAKPNHVLKLQLHSRHIEGGREELPLVL